MFEIAVQGDFSAAHQIRGYPGDCEELHGHNYRVEALVEASTLDHIGIGVDFKTLKQMLNSVTRHLDHKSLGELSQFIEVNPTAENVARHIFQELKKTIGDQGRLRSVRLWESETCYVIYSEDDEDQ